MTANMLLRASCTCGRVALELMGVPIVSLVCYCDDCQAGARQIEALPGAPQVQVPDGGTAYVAYRKDRVRKVNGADLLKALKLRPTSSTNRVIASCCNAPLFLSFDDGKHWIDVYRERIGADAPPLEMRVCTKFAREARSIPADIPRYAGYPLVFLARLVVAKIGMLLG
jgi:hypothetical protein